LKWGDRLVRVDNGLIVVPIADVHANDGLPRLNSAAVGHNPPLVGILNFRCRRRMAGLALVGMVMQ